MRLATNSALVTVGLLDLLPGVRSIAITQVHDGLRLLHGQLIVILEEPDGQLSSFCCRPETHHQHHIRWSSERAIVVAV